MAGVKKKPKVRWSVCFGWFRDRAQGLGIRVKGVEDVLVGFALCCHPLPGEHIVGFITRGRGVTVHTAAAPLSWKATLTARSKSAGKRAARRREPVKIEVTCVDQPGLLAAISSAITSAEANIARAQVRTFSSEKAVNTFDVMIKNSEHLKQVLQNISKVKGVYQSRPRARSDRGNSVEPRSNRQK